MQINKLVILFVFIGFVFSSCIDRYYLDESGDFEPVIVIEGTLTNLDGEQEVVVSMSSPPEKPKFNGLSDCNVFIEDDQGNKFNFQENSQDPGHYFGEVNGYYIVIGSKYRLVVETPDGEQYISSYETMNACPPVDSVYYEKETKLTSDPNIDRKGIQFYLNLTAGNDYGKYYRWKVEETFEYHSYWPVERYLDEEGEYHEIPADYTNYYCYLTTPLEDIYVLTTKGLSENKYNKFALNFVENDASQRLYYHYSLLIEQYSLSEDAYNFWNNLRKNNQEEEDIFGRQPSLVKSNIHNAKDTSEVVLGYFGVSAVSKKRIHIYGIPGFQTDFVTNCTREPNLLPPPDYLIPLYYAPWQDEEGNEFWAWSFEECFICTVKGGTTEKPSFWDEQ